MKQGFVYIMSNKNRTTTYIGVTNDIERRVLEHKSGFGSSFTKRYNLHDLIYFESISGMQNAIDREKHLKNWHKEWKWNLIKQENPELKDLAIDWYTTEEIEEFKKMKMDSETSLE
ncbi:MAG: GIY-YIG nuclease family protein [Bacteroidales bacterium]|jgi:putative endonuclease|nr:GIY-YIG nuclease family protein [Bacteroidales bacterium]